MHTFCGNFTHIPSTCTVSAYQAPSSCEEEPEDKVIAHMYKTLRVIRGGSIVYKCKKKKVRMVVQKKYTNQSSRENNRKGAPSTLFSSNRVSINNFRDAPCLLFSLLFLFVYVFGAIIPTNLLLLFLLC